VVVLSVGVSGVAGFLGGLLGVGGGNFIVPVLNWVGFDAKVAAGTTAFVVVDLSGSFQVFTPDDQVPFRRGVIGSRCNRDTESGQ
jgi:uncharacterized membrane protein YfcA